MSHGAAYLYRRDGIVWEFEVTLTAEDEAGDDLENDAWFGHAASLSGDTALIGAPRKDEQGHSNSGAAYVYRFDGQDWTLQAKLTAKDDDGADLEALARFGGAVSVIDNAALIGARFKDASGLPNAGATYVFLPPGPFTVGGNLSGLEGDALVLVNNDSDPLALIADGSFTFPTPLLNGTSYEVRVQSPPSNPSQSCIVTNGTGTIEGNDVTDINVDCITDARLELSADQLIFEAFAPSEAPEPQTIQITSTGEIDLEIGTLSLDGPDSDDFALTGNDCDDQVLEPGQWCSVEVSFIPDDATVAGAKLMVPSNALESPSLVDLVGIVDPILQDRFE